LFIDRLSRKCEEKCSGLELEEKKEIKKKYKRKKRLALFFCILISVAFLFVFKYLKFFTISLNDLLSLFNVHKEFEVIKFIAPLGISFYSLSALSYLFDVYNGKIVADKNPLRLALFVSFFPQIIEGPITRYSETAEKLYAGNKVTYKNFCFGMQRIFYGLFKKLVIADRLNIMIKTVFENYTSFSGFTTLLAAIGYTIMLYMEFSGTMDYVIGVGEFFDVKMPENFRQPFFSKNISEFWTRWHISLGTWFKDYIYYPISLSKPMRKLTVNARKVVGNHFGPLISSTIALFAVWALNGLWHGAGWTFILFGMYHFILIFLGNLFEPLIQGIFNKFKWNRENLGYRIFRSIKTTFFVIFGELIFRAPTVTIAFTMIKKIFTDFSLKISEFTIIGIDIADYLILFISLIIIFIISILKERKVDVLGRVNSLPVVVRWILFYILAFYIVIFGA
jgi:D-alanyl-lipoteichoic acid acyltransferase DltB (MBOAT superfamily)